MTKSELKTIIVEALQKTAHKGMFRNVLEQVTKEDSEEEKAKRGNAILDKADPKNVDRITKGKKPIYREAAEGDQKYLVYFTVADGDDDVEVSASSPEDAIEKVKSGKVKLAYGQELPRLARGFSAKLLKK